MPRSALAVDLGRIDHALGFLLRIAQLKTQNRFFEENAGRWFKPGEFTVLWVIARNPGIRQSVLGQQLMIKRAHMTKLIRAFEDQGLVTRSVPDDDRRAVELALTPQAKSRLEAAAAWFFAFEDRVADNLTREEGATLVALLRKYLELDGAMPEAGESN